MDTCAEPTLLVLDATPEDADEARKALLNLTTQPGLRLSRLLDAANLKHGRLAIVAPPGSVGAHGLTFRWHVDPIGSSVRRQFPTSTDAEHRSIVARVNESMRAGRWPDEIRSVQGFIRACRTLEDLSKVLGTVAADADLEAEGNDPLRLAAVWLAAFMPGLPYVDYRRVLGLLVENSTDEPTAPEVAGRPAIERWDKTFRTIAKESRISFTSPSPGERGVVRVVLDMTRFEAVTQQFRGPLIPYHLAFADHVRHSRLIFDDDLLVADAAIKVLVNCAAVSPPSHSQRWILSMIAPPTRVEVSTSDPLEVLATAAWATYAETRRRRVIARIGRLLQHMLDVGNLGDLVKRVLDELLRIPPLRDAAVLIVRDLRHPTFKTLEWLKRLASEGGQHVANEVAEVVFRLLVDAPGLDAMEALASWLPRTTTGQRTQAVPPVASAAIRAFVRWFEASISEPYGGTYGKNPPDNLVLKLFFADDGERALDLTIGVLFHPLVEATLASAAAPYREALVTQWLPTRGAPALEDALRARWQRALEDADRRDCMGSAAGPRQLFHAMLFAEWAIVLGGGGAQEAPPLEKLMPRIRDTLRRSCDPHQISRIAAFLHEVERSMTQIAADFSARAMEAPYQERPTLVERRAQIIHAGSRVRRLRTEVQMLQQRRLAT